jgi:hypothetical protein
MGKRNKNSRKDKKKQRSTFVCVGKETNSVTELFRNKKGKNFTL